MSKIDPLFAGLLAMQPTGHVAGSAIAYTGGIYAVADQKGNATVAKGLTVASTGSGGNLVVHLVDDYDASGAKVYCTVELVAGARLGFVFDEIKQAGTTVTLTELTLWL
jgi:hypothetical protein